jgi:hypothetical protein
MPKPFAILTMTRSGSCHLVELLNDHPQVVCTELITYEDLLADQRRCLEPVWDVLGVAEVEVTSPLKRLEQRPLRETVENYSELVREFSGTDYEGVLAGG